jgi:hypothetical protein
VTSAKHPPREVPLFGQAMADGQALHLRPKDVFAATLIALGQGASALPPNAALEALREAARPDSAAANLFAGGTAGAAPAGRIDDYKVPPATDE